jgi:hypothetical protein
VFLEEASIELEELAVGARFCGSDAVVGDLFAHDGRALSRGGAGVLDVDVASALRFGAVLIGGYAGHDVSGGGLLSESAERSD